jgi:hypothetical protein
LLYDAGRKELTMQDQDAELAAMTSIVGILGGLEEDSRSRVLRYAMERFKLSEPVRMFSGASDAPTTNEASSAEVFEGFATLFDAANPSTGSMRALVGGYWFQTCLGQTEFDGQSVNNELKNLGHPSKNITADLGTLMNQNPRLAMQVRKSGRSQQARKTYRLTTEGLRRVKALIGGGDGPAN